MSNKDQSIRSLTFPWSLQARGLEASGHRGSKSLALVLKRARDNRVEELKGAGLEQVAKVVGPLVAVDLESTSEDTLMSQTT